MITPLITLVEEIQSSYSVDPKRIYLTGSGMGGNGVWAIGLRHPEVFAALAPLDGYLNYPFAVPENICDLKDVPVWAFHGENDFMVPVEVEQELVDALNACGGNAQYTVKPGVVIPGEIYTQSELYEWFLSQSKK
jgi:predicted peptidase